MPPSWADLVLGALPPQREPEDREPGTTNRGWQHEAGMRVEGEFERVVRPHPSSYVGVDQVPGRPWSWRGAHRDTDQQRNDHPVPLVQSGGASVVFAKSSRSLHVAADVANHSILVATIEQLVRRRECSVDEDMHSKTLWHGFAGKLADVCAPI